MTPYGIKNVLLEMDRYVKILESKKKNTLEYHTAEKNFLLLYDFMVYNSGAELPEKFKKFYNDMWL